MANLNKVTSYYYNTAPPDNFDTSPLVVVIDNNVEVSTFFICMSK